MEKKIQQIYEINKYDEMIEYLKQDDAYWLSNDNWDINKLGVKKLRNANNLSFKVELPENIKMELKFLTLYSFKNDYTGFYELINRVNPLIKKIARYLKFTNTKIESINVIENTKFLLYLINVEKISEILSKAYVTKLSTFKNLLNELFDNKEETQKDVWNCMNILGVKMSATTSIHGYSINFLEYPDFYRSCMKRYFRTIITKKSLRQ